MFTSFSAIFLHQFPCQVVHLFSLSIPLQCFSANSSTDSSLSGVCVYLSFFPFFFFSLFFLLFYSHFLFFFSEQRTSSKLHAHNTMCGGVCSFFHQSKHHNVIFFHVLFFTTLQPSSFFQVSFFLISFFGFSLNFLVFSLSLSLSLSLFFFFFIFLKTQNTEQQLYSTNFSCVDFSWNFSSNFCYLGFFFSFFLSFSLFFLSFFSKKNTIHKEQTQNSIFCIFLFPLPH